MDTVFNLNRHTEILVKIHVSDTAILGNRRRFAKDADGPRVFCYSVSRK